MNEYDALPITAPVPSPTQAAQVVKLKADILHLEGLMKQKD